MEDDYENTITISSSSSSKKQSPESSSPDSTRRVESVGDLTILNKVINNNRNMSISSIQNSPRVMRAAVFSHDRPFESRKSSEDLLMLRGSFGATSRSLDPNAWAQVAIPVDLEPFLHPEKLFYPVVDSPKYVNPRL